MTGLFNNRRVLCAVALLSQTFFGCTTSPAKSERELPSNSGFLASYDHLTPSVNPETEGAYVYRNPDKPLSRFHMAMLDPVKVVLHPGSEVTPQDKEKLKTIARQFEAELRTAFGGDFPIVTQPGFGVMRVRTAVTDIQPGMTNLRGLSDAAGGGAVAVELEMIDTNTGDQIAAAVDMQKGPRIQDVVHRWALMVKDAIHESKGLHRGGQMRSTGNMWR